MSDYIERNTTFTRFEVGQSWAILSPIEQRIKRKIEAVGKPLKEWDVRINYGIKTGYNDAFIINGDKRNELISQDPKSAELIRPILRGRDIKRYGYDFADKWLIAAHNGVKEKNIPRVDVTKYPAIKKHLDQFYEQLAKRQDKGDTPYNLRNCAYWEDFFKQKIVWKRVGSILRFAFDQKGYMCLDSTCFIIGEHLKYLTYFLNSKICRYSLQNSPQTGTGDLLISVQAIEPVKAVQPKSFSYFEKYKNISEMDRDKVNQIDHEIYSLYRLLPDEIDFLEKY